ncbi:hypothetical protein QBC40DRAFT_322475 [Triangularia verruculosa]|uniref:Uncharacterized protein n=1 Tax=Triangularia verruculosa TaxID=2587418 RepID=A0AAN6XJJ2_9PEZI|nr:hypothetical protein QBC40DRAFT_322475 [Triangularia verruculosa]
MSSIWGLAALQNAFWLPSDGSQVETHLRDVIKKRIDFQHWDRRIAFTFSLPWTPTACFPNNRSELARSPLKHAYTLTGYGNNVQAATALDYMTQTWPSLGPGFFEFLAGALRFNNPVDPQAANIPGAAPNGNKTHIGIMRGPDGSEFSLTLKELGPPTQRLTLTIHSAKVGTVAEIGSQLAWFCGAFRMSSSMNEITYCRPEVEKFFLLPKDDAPFEKLHGHIKIAYKTVPFDSTKHPQPCWKALFTNSSQPYPCVVGGYKIRKEVDLIPSETPTANTAGLEVPWALLAEFLHGPVQPPKPEKGELLNKPMVLRGPHFILCSVTLSEKMVHWHLVPYDGRPTSFGNDPVHPPKPLRVTPEFKIELMEQHSRHFIGSKCGKYHPYVPD